MGAENKEREKKREKKNKNRYLYIYEYIMRMYNGDRASAWTCCPLK